MRTAILAAALAASCICPAVYSMNGKAVSAIARWGRGWSWNNPDSMAYNHNFGKIVVSTVTNNLVTHQDTVLRNADYFQPTFNINGTAFAYFKSGAGLCVYTLASSTSRVLVALDDWEQTDREQHIAWPAVESSKWVYYHRPCTSGEDCWHGGSGEIWRVNVNDPTEKSLVCDYKKVNNASSEQPHFQRFALSSDAQYANIWVIDGGTNQLGWGPSPDYVPDEPHTFPPRVDAGTGWINPLATGPSGDFNAAAYGCNAALSTSGAIEWNFEGAHNTIYAYAWNHTNNSIARKTVGTGWENSLDMWQQMDGWVSGGLGDAAGLNYPRGTCNSDQIVSVLVNWVYGAEWTNGGNQLVANWKDHEAVLVTNNPSMVNPNTGQPPDGSLMLYADGPGDFWLDNQGHTGCYENEAGNWVNGATGVVVSRLPSAASVKTPSALRGTVAVYSLTGARVGTFDAHSIAQGMSSATGTYVVTDRVAGGRAKVRLFGSGSQPR